MGNGYESQLDHFSEYHKSNEPSKKPIGPALPALGHAVSGSIGAALSHIFIYPLDLVITRLQIQGQFKKSSQSERNDDGSYQDVLDALQKIYQKEGGLRAFYSGAANCTAKAATDSFLFFLAYNFLREARRPTANSKGKSGTANLPVAEELLIGILAGAFARFWTTPMQNIVTRQQTAAMVHARDPNSSLGPGLSARDIALQIKDEKGIKGFWAGYTATLILTINPSITFLLHELLLRILVPRDRRSNPGPKITFLLAAASKAVASTLTYPFSLAKARAQVSSQPLTPPPSEVKSKLEEGDASERARQTEAVAARTTVFSTILQIAQTEGLWGLYQGLGGEVLKGFFAHGLTMLMKERIHSTVIQLYYLILKALRRYPSPEELAKAAGGKVGSAASGAKRAFKRDTVVVGDIYGKARKVEDRNVLDPVSKPINSSAGSARSAAETIVERVKDVVKENNVPPGDVYGKHATASSPSHPDPETRQLGRSADVQRQAVEKVESATSSSNTTVPPGDVYGKAETTVPQSDPEASNLKKAASAGEEMAEKAVEKVKEVVDGDKDTVVRGDVYGSQKKKE